MKYWELKGYYSQRQRLELIANCSMNPIAQSYAFVWMNTQYQLYCAPAWSLAQQLFIQFSASVIATVNLTLTCSNKQ